MIEFNKNFIFELERSAFVRLYVLHKFFTSSSRLFHMRLIPLLCNLTYHLNDCNRWDLVL